MMMMMTIVIIFIRKLKVQKLKTHRVKRELFAVALFVFLTTRSSKTFSGSKKSGWLLIHRRHGFLAGIVFVFVVKKDIAYDRSGRRRGKANFRSWMKIRCHLEIPPVRRLFTCVPPRVENLVPKTVNGGETRYTAVAGYNIAGRLHMQSGTIGTSACCLARVNYASRDPSFWGGFRWIVRPVECNVGSQPVSFAHHKVPENVFAGEQNLTGKVKFADMFVD